MADTLRNLAYGAVLRSQPATQPPMLLPDTIQRLAMRQDSIGAPPRTTLAEMVGKGGTLAQRLANALSNYGATIPGTERRITLKDLTLGDAGQVVEDWSYGSPPTTGGNYATGGIGTLGLQPRAMDLLNLGGVAGGAVQTGKVGAKVLGPTLREMARKGIEANMRATGGIQDLITWHGSPHTFDKFDASKIGTGEGKQQQGIGSYLADSPIVAQKYADKEAWKRGMDSGYLYKVDIPDDLVASMAQHEMPIAKQPANVQAGVLEMFDEAVARALKDYHGWDNVQEAPFAAVLDAIEIAKGNNRAAVADSLRKTGIPGIRYLDGNSRAAGGGTSNYVVFPGEESNLRILERNGQSLR